MSSGIADQIPDLVKAAVGFGLEFKPGATVKMILKSKLSLIEGALHAWKHEKEKEHKQAGLPGSTIATPFNMVSREPFATCTVSEMPCERVTTQSSELLEEALEVIGKNTQVLLEHYVGEDSGSSGVSLGRGSFRDPSSSRETADGDNRCGEGGCLGASCFLGSEACSPSFLRALP